MWDVEVLRLAERQFNRVARAQLLELTSAASIERWLAAGLMQAVEEGVYAIAPVLEHDDWGRWMGATLTAPGSVLSHQSSAAALGFWSAPRSFEAVTRPGDGGPRIHGHVRVYRSRALDGEATTIRGIPITTPERTLLDLARITSNRALARALRDAARLESVTVCGLTDFLIPRRRRSGATRLLRALGRYSGLPIERARSGAEVRALQVIASAGYPAPELNVRIAGEEADLSWPAQRLIIEVDGAPFHLDVGEDARKQAEWEDAGWVVRRVSSDDVYDHPKRLLALCPRRPGVPQK